MLRSNEYKKRIPVPFHSVLFAQVKTAIEEGKLSGMLTKEEDGTPGFVLMPSEEAETWLKERTTQLSRVLSRPRDPLPFPEDLVTPEIFEALIKAQSAKTEPREPREPREARTRPAGEQQKPRSQPSVDQRPPDEAPLTPPAQPPVEPEKTDEPAA